MRFRDKAASLIESFPSDIFVIQECECPERLSLALGAEWDIRWIGHNPHKGLAILARCGLLKESRPVPGVRYSLVADTALGFCVVGIWAMNERENYRQRYIAQVWRSFVYCRKELDGPVVVIGDFNWNLSFDGMGRGSLNANMADVLAVTADMGLTSAYHVWTGELHGQESRATFYLRKDTIKSYHTDFMFIPAEFLKTLDWRFALGGKERWLPASDHMPLQVVFPFHRPPF